MDKEKLTKYIGACRNLYGIIHKDKVIEIYNSFNPDDPVNNQAIGNLIKEKEDYLFNEYLVVIKEGYLSYISYSDNLAEEIEARTNYPYYIPATEEELLKYEDWEYFKKTDEYNELFNFLRKKYWYRSKNKVTHFACEIQKACRDLERFENMPFTINYVGIKFKSEKKLYQFRNLVLELRRNTRARDYNGFTPIEVKKEY